MAGVIEHSLALSRCLACARALPSNEELEWLPVGRRVAFDAHRGRLWVICDWCAHWSLVPMDARWEAVEELEKASADRGIVRVATENVALIALGSIQALRVGGAKLHEEAWWRFGQSFRGRHLRYRRLTTAGGSIAAAGAVSGRPLLLSNAPRERLVAIELVMTQRAEARALGQEIAELEARWRDEETIASIIDAELTPRRVTGTP